MTTAELSASVPSVFHDDGTLDRDGQARLAATYVDAGSANVLALEPGGGEPERLDPDERDQVVRAIRDGAGGVPIVVGVGTANTAAIARTHRAGAAGAAGVIVTCPHAGQREAELVAEVAAVGLPVWLHLPASTARGPAVAGVLDLAADIDAATVIVEAVPTPDTVTEVVRAGRRTLGGLAALFLPEEVEVGASGTIAAAAVPELLVEVLRDVPEAPPFGLDAYLALLPYLRLEAGSAGLRVRKEAWRQRGVIASGRTREGAPLGSATKVAITRRLRTVGATMQAPYPGA